MISVFDEIQSDFFLIFSLQLTSNHSSPLQSGPPQDGSVLVWIQRINYPSYSLQTEEEN